MNAADDPNSTDLLHALVQRRCAGFKDEPAIGRYCANCGSGSPRSSDCRPARFRGSTLWTLAVVRATAWFPEHKDGLLPAGSSQSIRAYIRPGELPLGVGIAGRNRAVNTNPAGVLGRITGRSNKERSRRCQIARLAAGDKPSAASPAPTATLSYSVMYEFTRLQQELERSNPTLFSVVEL
jgi:hypothetical protein